MKSETHPVSLQSSQTARTPTVIGRATGGFWRGETVGTTAVPIQWIQIQTLSVGGQCASFHPPF